jgi:molybdate transport system substrate-binding protein
MNLINFRNIYTKSYSCLWFFALFLAVFAPSLSAYSKDEKQAFDRSIVVFAPTSMTNALNEVIQKFSAIENISVSGNFDSAAEISRLLLEGEPAHIYITDDATKMRDLQRLGVLNVFSVTNIGADSIALAIPLDNFLKKRLESLSSIDEKLKFVAKNVSLVIPDPEADPAGKAAKQAFEKIGVWQQVSDKMLKAANTRNALYLISNGNTPGIVYNSDISLEKNVEALVNIPAEYHDKITYQASIVAEIGKEANKNESDKFILFLKSDFAKKVFAKYGFESI